MNKTIYKQLDSRWSSKPYPTKSSSFGGNGCGCCACTHIAIEQTSKASWTPENLRKWMINQGYAYAGQGTSWEGITGTLKHIGHKNVVRIYNDPMTEAWKELNKGDRIGIILFSAGWGGKTKGKKVYWTAGGHYIAFTDYKVKNNKHYFYMKDSGGRGNDGWFTYEDSMYGVVSKVWIVEKISEEKKAYSGEFPKINDVIKTANTQVKEGIIKWCKKIVADGSYHYVRWTADELTHKCAVCHPEKYAKNKAYKGWQCIGFATAALKHGGTIPVSCSCSGTCNDGYGTKMFKNPKKALQMWKDYKKNGDDWIMIYNDGKKIPESKLQAGDVLLHSDTKDYKTFKHETIKGEKGYVYHASGSNKPISKAKFPISSRPCVMAFRYTGKGKLKDKVVAGCLKSGDEGSEVKKLQEFLLWYGYDLGSFGADGDFGAKTETAVKKFQKVIGLTQDGKWTNECSDKAKEIKK